jgi:predicted membrane protein
MEPVYMDVNLDGIHHIALRSILNIVLIVLNSFTTVHVETVKHLGMVIFVTRNAAIIVGPAFTMDIPTVIN